MIVAKRRRRGAMLLYLVTLVVLAGCTSGDRTSDSDQRPVFYGGVSGAPYTK